MELDIAKKITYFLPKDDIITWLKLYNDRKVSRNFLDKFTNMVQKFNDGHMSTIMSEIREALEDEISEDAIIWLYNPDADFNKFYTKEILSKGQALGQEPTKTYFNLRLNQKQRKKLREAFKCGLTIDQVSLIAKSKFHEDEMVELIKYLKLGVGLNIDYSAAFSKVISEMEREAKSKLEEILFSM